MNRPQLRRQSAGVYLTTDQQFTLRALERPGPRGGRRRLWAVDGEPGEHLSLTAAANSVLDRIRGRSGFDPDGGIVYLLCFDRPFRHARHYLGWTNGESVQARLKRHRAGSGANLLRHVNLAGIGYDLVRTWPGGRTAERRLKNRSSLLLCPRCRTQRRAEIRARRNPEGRRLERDPATGRYRTVLSPSPVTDPLPGIPAP